MISNTTLMFVWYSTSSNVGVTAGADDKAIEEAVALSFESIAISCDIIALGIALAI